MLAIFVLRFKAAVRCCDGIPVIMTVRGSYVKKRKTVYLSIFNKKFFLQPLRQPIDNKSEIFKGLTKTHFYNINNNNK